MVCDTWFRKIKVEDGRTGKIWNVGVEPQDNVEGILKAIMGSSSNARSWALVYKGKQLAPKLTVQQIGLENDDTLKLWQQVEGGVLSNNKLINELKKKNIIKYFSQINKQNFFSKYYNELLKRFKSNDFTYFEFSEKVLNPSEIDKIHQTWALLKWEGIIYRVKQVKRLDGTKLKTPKYIYIGQTTWKLSKRKNNELSRSRNMDFGKRNAFYKELSKFNPKRYSNAKIDIRDAFEWEIIDICFSTEELNAKEAFWTKYYMEETSHNLLNYYIGPPSWGQSIDGYMDKYFFDDSDPEIQGIMFRTNSKGIKASRAIALKPWFDAALGAGLSGIELWDLLEKNNIQLLRKQYPGAQHSPHTRKRAINKYSKYIYGANYDEVRIETYLKPAINRLQEHGIKIIGKGTEEINLENFLELFDGSQNNKVGDGYSGKTTKWGLIEWLAFSGLTDGKIADLFGTDVGKIRSYYHQRYGYNSGPRLRRFLHSNYLSSSGN